MDQLSRVADAHEDDGTGFQADEMFANLEQMTTDLDELITTVG